MGKKNRAQANLIAKYTSSTGSASSSARKDPPPSVNDLLTNLRTHPTSTNAPHPPPRIVPSLPAEIRHLLDIPDTPTPRPGRHQRFDEQGRRLPAGPTPPQGWLERSKRTQTTRSSLLNVENGRLRSDVDSLAGLKKFPARGSLVATCLREMAYDWKFYAEYEKNNLGTLPTEIRMLLLSYIATYGPDEGVGLQGLKTIIFPPEATQDAFYGNDDFHRLDLSGCIGRSISMKQLQKILRPTESSDPLTSTLSTTQSEDTTTQIEDWQSALTALSLTATITPTPTFPTSSLRSLSLAYPTPNDTITSAPALWSSLLLLTPSLPLLTHLSLSGWPFPSHSRSPISHEGRYDYWNHTVQRDHDYSIPASILHTLSTHLYSLTSLTLSPVPDWLPALYWPLQPCIRWGDRSGDGGSGGGGANWKSLTRIDLRPPTTPPQQLLPMPDINSTLNMARRAAKDNMWISEWGKYKRDLVRAGMLEEWIQKERGWVGVGGEEKEMVVERGEWGLWDYLWEGKFKKRDEWDANNGNVIRNRTANGINVGNITENGNWLGELNLDMRPDLKIKLLREELTYKNLGRVRAVVVFEQVMAWKRYVRERESEMERMGVGSGSGSGEGGWGES